MQNAFPPTLLPQLACTTAVSCPLLGKAAVSSADKFTVVNIVTDTTLALLPVPLVWNLQLDMRTKATVTMILGLGFLYACTLTGVVLLSRMLTSPVSQCLCCLNIQDCPANHVLCRYRPFLERLVLYMG